LQETDVVLVERAAQGDAHAFQALVSRHAAGLFRLACSLVGNRTDAEDVLQETFVGAFRSLPRFERRASFRTWLGQILVRQAASLRRSRATRRTMALDAPHAAVEPSVAGGTSEVDYRADLGEALQQLSPEHREVLVLREFEQLSYDDIAAALGVPRGTVESRLHRARGELRALLEDYQHADRRAP
jgi:RNA polymerase sigma-70 factor (ECF subfamily)